MGQKSSWKWINTAVSGIRFQPDRAAVERELREHLEDKMADLRRLYPDLSEEEAESMAVERMGDAEEIGRDLAKIHKPWLGYLLRASQVLLAVSLALALLCALPWVRLTLSELSYGTANLSTEERYQMGLGLKEEGEGVERKLVALLKAEERPKAAGYRFRVERAALWSFQREGSPERRKLFCQLWAESVPWIKLPWEAARRIEATDSLGNHYLSREEFNAGYPESKGERMVEINTRSDDGLLREKFDVSIGDIPADAQWVRLEYSLNGAEWSLTIPLKGA